MTRGITWTQEECKILIDNHHKGAKFCSTQLTGRSPKACKTQLKKLGITYLGNPKIWTLRELSFLQENYPNKGASFCANALGRTLYSVRKCASRNKIYSMTSGGHPPIAEGKTLLYFISFTYENITYYKLGLTTKTLRKRFSSQWKTLGMKLLWSEIYNTGKEAYAEEQRLRAKYSEFLHKTSVLYSGNTEVFTCMIEKSS